MPYLLASPNHQQPCRLISSMNGSLTSTRTNFSYLCNLGIEKWYKSWDIWCFTIKIRWHRPRRWFIWILRVCLEKNAYTFSGNFAVSRWHRSELKSMFTWWRHQMETLSALLALWAGNSPVTREFPSQRPVTRSFDVFFDLCLNKRSSKQSRRWWFDTPSRSLWNHCNNERQGHVYST